MIFYDADNPNGVEIKDGKVTKIVSASGFQCPKNMTMILMPISKNNFWAEFLKEHHFIDGECEVVNEESSKQLLSHNPSEPSAS